LTAFFGERRLKNITPTDVHAFIVDRKEQGKAAATINGEVAHLSHMFTWANKLKLTTHNPCRDISKLKANKKTVIFHAKRLAVCWRSVAGTCEIW